MGSDRGSQTVAHLDGDAPAGRSLTSLLTAVALTIPALSLLIMVGISGETASGSNHS